MSYKSTATILKTSVVAILLFVLLFIDADLGTSPIFISFILREVATIYHDPRTQWMVFLCLGIYLTLIFSLRSRTAPDFWRPANPNLWLACLLLISAVLYAIDYTPATQPLILLSGAVLGQAAATLACFKSGKRKTENGNSLGILVISLLVILLALASVLNRDLGHFFEYRNQARWSGLWNNPNIFGLLMGTGIALTLGLISSIWHLASGKIKRWFLFFLCAIAAILMARGLLHSYSRGAWLGTVCGLAYLIAKSEFKGPLKASCSSCISWFEKNLLLLSVILASIFALVFWHFRQTDWHPARRALSAVNTVDFSWRNRVAAWEGALQITAEHPWFGAGWNQPEPLYEHYFLPTKLSESAAIEMNDYLMLGATLGILALFCFGMYLWLSLMRNAECEVRNSGNGNRLEAHPALADSLSAPGGRGEGQGEVRTMQSAEIGNQNTETGWKHCPTLGTNWLQTTCHAGAIVLLVGFWFDGGLFELPTAATFWILLELGAIKIRHQQKMLKC
jgi:O-antigen ligase